MSIRVRTSCVLCALGGAALASSPAKGAAIFNRSAFDGVSSILIDFETFGVDNTPYNLPEGGVGGVLSNQYSHLGVAISSSAFVANDSFPDTEAALEIVGSLQHTLFLMGGSGDEVGFFFGPGIHSVGISVLRNTDIIQGPLIARAYGRLAPGEPVTLLQEVVYDSSTIQGQVGVIDYGFIGFTSDVPILSFVFDFTGQDDVAIQYDDLIFSTAMVPAPGGALVMLGAGAMFVRRRR